jgi:hypothetical protein
MTHDILYESVNIILENSPEISKDELIQILEDVNSPITRKFQEKLYKSVIDKAHVDFGDIPKSAGNIRNYSGYNSMIDTINAIESLAKEEKAIEVLKYVKILNDAIKNIADLSATYQKGFQCKSEYVGLEYNSYVYLCVQATTALIYGFIDVVKDPRKRLMEIKIKNSKVRADLSYFEQLQKFNAVCDKYGVEYNKSLEAMMKDKDNFTGGEIGLGVAAIVAIVPVTLLAIRKILSTVYNSRVKLSDYLKTQSEFLELNKACVESNQMLTEQDRNRILKDQQEKSITLKRLADKISVKARKAVTDTNRELDRENKSYSLNSLVDDVESSSLEIF